MTELKHRFATAKTVFGTWISIGNSLVAELLAGILKPDFIGIDLEHTTFSLDDARHLFLAVQSQGCAALPRVASHDHVQMRRLLDAGADGVIVPNVSNATELAAIIEGIKYPPVGKRGYGVSRAQGYGRDFKTYTESWNQRAILIIIIETLAGVKNCEALLSNPHVDGVLIGRYDLSGELQVPGQVEHPDVLEARQTIIECCKKLGKNWGETVSPVSESAINDLKKEGAQFIFLSSDLAVLSHWAQATRNHLAL